MRRLGLIFVAVAGMATSANAAGLLTYTGPRASIVVDGQAFGVSIHPRQDLILIQAGYRRAPGLTHPKDWPIDMWRAAAEQLVEPIGCGIPEVKVISKMGGSWEASFLCPEGVDLRQLFKEQRAAVDAEQPLHR